VVFAVGRGWVRGAAANQAPANSSPYLTHCHSERNEMKRKNLILKNVFTGKQCFYLYIPQSKRMSLKMD
jgi:hypothetical protein